ncbi:response regulator [bacterium]|nr:response regulator [bacterium]
MNSSLLINENLLVVEDDAELRDAICETLGGLGAPVISAANAEDALTLVRENICFAVISDYRMPGMNGIDFCRVLKEELPGIKFVILTGYADKQTVLEGFRVGIDDLLEKPQDLAHLRDKAEAFVRDRARQIEQEQEEMKAIRKIFCAEANDILRDIETFIFRLEETPLQSDVVDVLFRKAHTLKGSAGAFQGAEKIQAVTHAYENLLQSIKKGRLRPSQALTQVLLQGADVIKSLVVDFENFRATPVNLQPFVDALNRWTEGQVGNNAQVASESQQTQFSPTSEPTALPSPLVIASETATSADDEEDGIMVTIDKLNSFMELSGELVVLKNAYHATIKQVLKCQIPAEQKQRLEEMNQSMDKISEQIQSQIMEVRKVQLKVAFQKFPRVVRQASQDLQKQVRIEMSGIDLGVDKSIAKALSSSLVHVLRNSVDHGIERPDIRVTKGKPESGTISIQAQQIGEQIKIIIDDDGAGIDPERVKKKAFEKGLIDKEQMTKMTPQEAMELIFLPGFSTADQVTNVSGRGVGMDVVKTEVTRLCGTVNLESSLGKGTTITITIPVPKTVLVENTLLAESGGHQIVVPLVSISKIAPVKDLILSKVDGRMTCQHDGLTIPLGDYRSFIESPLKGSSLEKIDFSPDALVLIISHKNCSLALAVDRVIDQLEAVIRPFDNVVEKLVGFKGTSLLDSEQVAFVLDAESLLGAAYAA